MARITVVGSGVVGQASGRGFLHHGHEVTFVDINPEIIERLRLEGLTAKFPDEVHWAGADITMLAINTPNGRWQDPARVFPDGLRTVAEGLRGSTRFHVVVVRSTVPPTTTVNTVLPLLQALSGRRGRRLARSGDESGVSPPDQREPGFPGTMGDRVRHLR